MPILGHKQLAYSHQLKQLGHASFQLDNPLHEDISLVLMSSNATGKLYPRPKYKQLVHL
jgi:hypothetical protein